MVLLYFPFDDIIKKKKWKLRDFRTLIYLCGGLVTKSHPTLVTLSTVAFQAPLSMGFSKQEYCSGLPFPSSGNCLKPGIKPGSPALQSDSLPTNWAMREAPNLPIVILYITSLISWKFNVYFTGKWIFCKTQSIQKTHQNIHINDNVDASELNLHSLAFLCHFLLAVKI